MKLAKPPWYKEKTPPNLPVLFDYCYSLGVEVVPESNLLSSWAGYDKEKRIIYVSKAAPSKWLAPILAHETFHLANGHNGHQTPAIENQINQLIALKFIDVKEYAYYESQYGANPGALADALGLPRSIVEAFQARLRVKALT